MRKRSRVSPDPFHIKPEEEVGPSVQAYEATIVRNQPDIARKILHKHSNEEPGGLVPWSRDGDAIDEDDILTDRFDARLLLSSALRNEPGPSASAAVSPVANIGWEDLPPDAEDTFFLSPLEIENLRIDQRRRDMERNRVERMRTISSREDGPRPNETDVWGGSDEEPDATQMLLMNRTAAHIRDSPNRAQLEMRILANHGSDPHFAFLRGRWKRAWDRAKTYAISSLPKPSHNALGGLADYDESDGESDSEPEREVRLITEGSVIAGLKKDEEEKIRRRERAREWSAKRRKTK